MTTVLGLPTPNRRTVHPVMRPNPVEAPIDAMADLRVPVESSPFGKVDEGAELVAVKATSL